MLKRCLSLYIFFIFCFMVLLARIYNIAGTDYRNAAANQSLRTLIVSERRGTIYDRSLQPLVNAEKKLLQVVTPCLASYEYLKDKVNEDYLKEKIKNGSPFIIEGTKEINTEYIRSFSVFQRYQKNNPALHLIGYTNIDGKGVCGIERAYDSYLSRHSGSLSVGFQVDAVGRVLAGMDKYITDNNYSDKAGVVLTIDLQLQKKLEAALQSSDIENGCGIITKASTGEILAMASLPLYDPENVADSLNKENSPLVNKALMSYSVGSVFKALVAAAALEKGISRNYKYQCQGEITLGDKAFHCYNHKSHGKINMSQAMEFSCNTYFVNLAEKIDADFLLELCSSCGLGKELHLAEGLVSHSGTLPTKESLSIKGNLANFAFGQGELTATPLQIAALYGTLVTGCYTEPRVVSGLLDSDGSLSPSEPAEAERIFKEKTVKAIGKILCSYNSPLKGKTGTAQSGIFKNGKEVLRTWYAGSYPADNSQYIIVILNENGESGVGDCLPVASDIFNRH